MPGLTARRDRRGKWGYSTEEAGGGEQSVSRPVTRGALIINWTGYTLPDILTQENPTNLRGQSSESTEDETLEPRCDWQGDLFPGSAKRSAPHRGPHRSTRHPPHPLLSPALAPPTAHRTRPLGPSRLRQEKWRRRESNPTPHNDTTYRCNTRDTHLRYISPHVKEHLLLPSPITQHQIYTRSTSHRAQIMSHPCLTIWRKSLLHGRVCLDPSKPTFWFACVPPLRKGLEKRTV
jgi:hypothetical protein